MVKIDTDEFEDREFIDKHNMYSVLEKFPQQISDGYRLGEYIKVDGEVDRIIITGMGGSALPGDLLKAYLGVYFKIPVIVNKGYELPEYITSKTLVFAISYSGNTEETINAYRIAIRKNCHLVSISAGGKLEVLSEKQKIPHIQIPSGLQPRQALGYLFFSMLRVLVNSKIISNVSEEVEKTAENLGKDIFREKARELSNKLVDKIPLIYCSDRLQIIAYRWKINFNENTKIHAFSNVIPEMNHNEIIGFTNLKGNYHAIILRDEDDNIRIKKRIKITKELIKKKNVPVTEIALTGSSFLNKAFSAIYIGDWASYFLALKYKTDPTPVPVIEELKKEMG